MAKFPFSPIKHLCPKFKLSSGDEKNIGTEKGDMKNPLEVPMKQVR